MNLIAQLWRLSYHQMIQTHKTLQVVTLKKNPKNNKELVSNLLHFIMKQCDSVLTI